jgi:predicted DNA-binding protein with PD1-like motif
LIGWTRQQPSTNALFSPLIKKLPSTQEGKLSFLLSKFETSDIKTAFANAIGRVGKPAKMVFYPLPPRKEKLVKGFLELISAENSIMVNRSKNSFR